MADEERLDKFLWAARFVKTRKAAQELIAATRPRLNGQPTSKAHATLRPGDIVTFAQNERIRVVRIHALSEKRLSPSLARELYEDLDTG